MQYSPSIHLHKLSKSNAHLVHTFRQMQYSPSAHLLRHRCQYSPSAHLVPTQYTSDTQLMFCSPFPFCNAHLVLTCNAHLMRCVLGEHKVRIEWELTFHFCLGYVILGHARIYIWYVISVSVHQIYFEQVFTLKTRKRIPNDLIFLYG